MKKYIKRIWFTVTTPIAGIIICAIIVPLKIWPNVWRGKQDLDPWDFWNK